MFLDQGTMIVDPFHNDDFFSAAADLRYLLERGYPRPGSLIFVGNHYQLNKKTRDILRRGVYPAQEAARRRKRLLSPAEVSGRMVGVDGHNVLITLESALSGHPLVECDDGLIRDITGAFRSYQQTDVTEQALTLVIDWLVNHGVDSVLFLFDAPLSRSAELAAHVGAVLAERGIMGRAHAVPIPDVEFYSFKGLTATSDSVLIDRVESPIDLAGHIIRDQLPKTERIGLHKS
jgi:hypothetical protein